MFVVLHNPSLVEGKPRYQPNLYVGVETSWSYERVKIAADIPFNELQSSFAMLLLTVYLMHLKRKHARKKFSAVLEESLDGTGNMKWVDKGEHLQHFGEDN
jgi:hypothetical protein